MGVPDHPPRCHRLLPTSPARRTVLQSVAGLALAWMTPRPAAAQDAGRARPGQGDLLVRVGDATSTPLTPADVSAGPKATIAWPMSADDRVLRSGSRLNRVVLIRLDPDAMAERTRALSTEGIVAYSAICTHTGCEVGDFLPDEQALYCECHQSKFDPRDQARVTDGPAPRNLPALPLGIVEGRLVVAGPFTARPGFVQGAGDE